MLSQILESKYLQYKEDTRFVASWLAKTARTHGYPLKLLVNEDLEKEKLQATVKGNKRAKREKKGAQKADSSKATDSEIPTYLLDVKQFVLLAKWIAAYNNPPVRVPSDFVGALNRAIALRSDYGKQISSKNEESANRHKFFITILERVRKVLCCRTSTESNSEPGSNTIVNKFEQLEVEEAPTAASPTLEVSTATFTQATEANYEPQLDDNLEEVHLAFELILEDFNRLRAVISRTWKRHSEEEIEIEPASIMTNTALDLARNLEEEANSLFRKYGSSEKLLERLWTTTCEKHGEDNTRRDPGEMSSRMYEAADHLLWTSYVLLSSFLKNRQSESLHLKGPDYFARPDVDSDRSTMTPRGKFEDDKIIMYSGLADFFLTSTAKVPVPEDELTRGLRTAFETNELPLWLILAAQVYLDIHHAMGQNVMKCYANLRRNGSFLQDSMEANSDIYRGLWAETWHAADEQKFQNLRSELKRFIFWESAANICEYVKVSDDPDAAFVRMLACHPLRCGLFQYSLRIRFQELGVSLANEWGSVLYAYHLYQALLQEELIQPNWHDMNLLMSWQNGVLLGVRPSKFDGYLKRLALSLGVPSAKFDSTGRKPFRLPRNGPRGMLKELAPLSLMFKHRYCDADGRIDLTLQDLEKIVSRSVWKKSNPIEDPPGKKAEASSSSKPGKKPAKSSGARPTAENLLESLRDDLMGEALELQFNYLLMHRVCWNLFRAVHKECDLLLQERLGSGYLKSDDDLPFLTYHILRAVTPKMQKRQPGQDMSPLLLQAAAVVGAFTEQKRDNVFSVVTEFNNWGLSVVPREKGDTTPGSYFVCAPRKDDQTDDGTDDRPAEFCRRPARRLF